MTIIEQIKAEIERRINELSEAETNFREEGCDSISAFLISGISELQKILSFISTLESEKPMNQEGLVEEVEKCLKHYQMLAVWKRDFTEIARHFAQWGAEQMKEQMMKDAVDATVHLEPGATPVIEIGVGRFGLKVRDKVKLIIVKED